MALHFSEQPILKDFDFGDEWPFSVQVLAIKMEEKEPDNWTIIETVGDNPSQYGDDDDDDADW